MIRSCMHTRCSILNTIFFTPDKTNISVWTYHFFFFYYYTLKKIYVHTYIKKLRFRRDERGWRRCTNNDNNVTTPVNNEKKRMATIAQHFSADMHEVKKKTGCLWAQGSDAGCTTSLLWEHGVLDDVWTLVSLGMNQQEKKNTFFEKSVVYKITKVAYDFSTWWTKWMEVDVYHNAYMRSDWIWSITENLDNLINCLTWYWRIYNFWSPNNVVSISSNLWIVFILEICEFGLLAFIKYFIS